MESQTQNPEFRINPENFHLCIRVCQTPRMPDLLISLFKGP